MRLVGSDIIVNRSELVLTIGLNTVKSAITRKQITRGHYSFNSLPLEWQNKVLSYFGHTTQLELLEQINGEANRNKGELKDQALANLPTLWATFIDTRDGHWYRCRLGNSKVAGLGDKIKDLERGIAIFRMLQTWHTMALIKQYTGFRTREELMKALCTAIRTEGSLVECLPASYQRFRTAFYDFNQKQGDAAREVLVSGHWESENARKFSEEQKAIVLELYLRPNKPDAQVCYQDYIRIAQDMLANGQYIGKGLVGYTTVKSYCASKEVAELVSKCRHGSSYYETTVRPLMLKKRPDFAYSLLVGDGVNIGRRIVHTRLVKDKTTGKEVETEVIGLMSVWFWWDRMSDAVVAYDIAPTEDSAQIRRGLRNVINMHEGICPASILLDKKWEKNPEINTMCTKLGIHLQEKRAYSPWQNMAENNNKRLNHAFRLMDELWINRTPGRSIDNANNEDLQKGAKPLPEHEFRSMVADLVNILNHTERKVFEGKTCWQMLKDTKVSPYSKKIDAVERTWVFGATTLTTVRGGKFSFKIASRDHHYVLPDWEEFRNRNIKNNRVRVYYDEGWLDTVHIYAFETEDNQDNDRFLYVCKVLARVNDAEIERTQEDHKLFAEEMARKKATDKAIKDKTEKRHQILEDLGLDLVTIKGTTQERYKEAMQNTEAVILRKQMEMQDRKMGHKVKPEKQTQILTDREKFLKYQNMSFDE